MTNPSIPCAIPLTQGSPEPMELSLEAKSNLERVVPNLAPITFTVKTTSSPPNEKTCIRALELQATLPKDWD